MPGPFSRVCAALAAVILFLTPIAAQAEWRRIARLSAEQQGQVRLALTQRGDLARLIDRYIPYFKVRATDRRITVCSVRYGHFECWEENRGQYCPSEIEIQVEGVPSPARVPITCIGPDASGECECDFIPG